MTYPHFDELFERIPALHGCAPAIEQALQLLSETYLRDGVIYCCGNGGSAADAAHIVGELGKGFLSKRPVSGEQAEAIRKACPAGVAERLLSHLQRGIRAHSLVSENSLVSAIANDLGGEFVFAQQIFAWGRPGDALIAVSTSGMAENVVQAVWTARALGIRTVGLTGRDGGVLGTLADIAIRVPARKTHEIQELHIAVYHALCAELEAVLLRRSPARQARSQES